MKQGYVYIMASVTRTLYIGVTNSLEVRVSQHQHGEIPGFTKRYDLDRLVYFEHYDDIRDAIAREKQLKGWRRSKKNALIESINPDWRDLTDSLYETSPPGCHPERSAAESKDRVREDVSPRSRSLDELGMTAGLMAAATS